MSSLRYYLIYVLATLTRFFPWPTKPGIVKIGSPGPSAPVLVTGNYILTVEIAKRKLRGLDAYLLVANSNGINVWCAATGGHFSSHDVVSILKTSGIQDLVGHSTYILPQLAATGIETQVVKEKTGWTGIWGPINIRDTVNFIEDNYIILKDKRTVEFRYAERIEMAVAWAFLISIILGIPLAFFSIPASLLMVGIGWYISLIMFLTFPLFEGWFMREKNIDGLPIWSKLLYPGVMLVLFAPSYYVMVTFFQLSTVFNILVPVLSLLIIITLVFDLKGSTPTFKSDMHKDRIFDIRLDEDKCVNAGDCDLVCPKNCFDFHEEDEVVSIPRPEACVQCGACIVQCPADALYLQNQEGEMLGPEVIRKYKLNLMGDRAGKACDCTVCKVIT